MAAMRLLDLFCGEGGAGAGYAEAGFEVVGVDIARRTATRYPYRHHRADALEYAAAHGAEYDAIHASPPCKVHTALAVLNPDDLGSMLFPMATHTDLVAATREVLVSIGRPWIIENVPGAPLVDPVLLCGYMFDLEAECEDGLRRHLRRHRLFESNVPLTAPPHPPHRGKTIGVYGHGARRWSPTGAYQGNVAEAKQALGIPWMSRDGLSQSIPPAYTAHLGRQLADAVVINSAV